MFAMKAYDPGSEEERIPYLGYIGQDDYEADEVLVGAAIRIFKQKVGRPPKRMVVGIHEVGHVGLEMRAKGIAKIATAQGIPVETLDITCKSYFTKHWRPT